PFGPGPPRGSFRRMDRGFGYGGGGLATRRRSSSGHLRICVSGGCRVESDGMVWAPVSGRSRSCSLIETIASESETIESFCRGSRIREVELPRLDGGFELWSTTPCSIQYRNVRTPKGTKNEAGYPAKRFSYQKVRNSRSPCRNWS